MFTVSELAKIKFAEQESQTWRIAVVCTEISSNLHIVAWELSYSISHGDDFEKTAFESFDHAVPKCLLAFAFSSRQFRQ